MAGLLLRLSANADQLSLVSSQARVQSGDALTRACIELVEMLRAGLSLLTNHFSRLTAAIAAQLVYDKAMPIWRSK